jgi:hypothetical protein
MVFALAVSYLVYYISELDSGDIIRFLINFAG